MDRAGTNKALVVSSLDAPERDVVINGIAMQLVENVTTQLWHHGSMVVLELPVPITLLDRVSPEWRGASMVKYVGEDEPKPMPSLSQSISCEKSEVRGIQWLRRTMHDFFNETSRRFVAAAPRGCKVEIGVDRDDSKEGSLSHSMSCSSLPEPFSSPLDMRASLLNYLLEKWGDHALVRQAGTDLLRAIQYHREWDVETQLFSALLSCTKYEDVDIQLFLQWWLELQHHSYPHRAGGRQVPAGKLWSVAKMCLSACSLASVTKTPVTRRVQNVLARWFGTEEKGGAGDGVSIPDTTGHPHVFSLPYSIDVLRWFVGVSTPLPSTAGLTPRLGAEHTAVPEAHLLALLLLNTKMERLRQSPRVSPPSVMTREARTIVGEPDSTNDGTNAAANRPDCGNNETDVEVWVGVCDGEDGTEADCDTNAEVHLHRDRGSITVRPAQQEASPSTVGLSLRDHETRFRAELEGLEQRVARTIEHHQRVTTSHAVK
ncbi:hypothetical protein DQ04_00271020 [Trypanosoma grayi]|uniref:hypothetical protein n=1 Tax=Trypanosoma grayi TaxID=71804 RepID=UPI0004F40567|nr:hypothetical protein DQ04_00271020 [Trypanosoma grayi]KEG14868.1 hypothetical protein DQ04_00271020 [Trypanosoma grayi]